ncbi:MAG: tRNA (adenosine(37)-N6)-threonylcarbamoyltransferase complex ATPase subunit type 1 TsaE [Epsilonproteobacteria bacterium]|nr:tRNA (adenosine(37)-N6)-threonylcarbamoyltransferase complex ATPase subunit type 1 TsaE [Campylobacterota bacterium]
MKIKASLDELDSVVDAVKKNIDTSHSIVLLQGDLASGKTTFVKRFVESFGLKDAVTSPTFSLQSVYGDKIYHYDIYNKSLEEFLSLGLLEEFEKEGIHLVEWGDDRLKEMLLKFGFDVAVLKIKRVQNKREYEIDA